MIFHAHGGIPCSVSTEHATTRPRLSQTYSFYYIVFFHFFFSFSLSIINSLFFVFVFSLIVSFRFSIS